MKGDIRFRVLLLIKTLSNKEGRHISVRMFCLENDINYVTLYNVFKSDTLGMKLADAFKKAVPNLNMNWFLYNEGHMFISEKLTIYPIKT